MRHSLLKTARWLLGLVATTGCGAKTGLWVPCVAPLEHDHPQVMLVIDRSGSMGSTIFGMQVTAWETLLAGVGATLPAVQSDVALGAVAYPLAPSGLDVHVCTVPQTIGLAPGLNQGGAAMQYLHDVGGPGGGTPTFDALGLAADYLRRHRSDVAQFIVLSTDGGPNCNPSIPRAMCSCWGSSIDNCYDSSPFNPETSVNCDDSERTVAQVRAIAAEGITTLVLGIELAPDTNAQQIPFEQTLDAMAEAGGAPLRTGPHRYYRADSPDTLRASLEQALLPLSYCRLRAGPELVSGSEPVLRDEAGLIAHDASRTDGWEWTDRARGALAVYGAACERLVAARAVPGVVLPGRRCIE